MKKILYFVPVALGLLTLASCSDADALFNGADNLEGMTTLKVTEQPGGVDIDDVTRAYRGEDYTTSKYVNGDAIRVYDSKMQKYATFTHNGTIFATPTTDATEGDYAWGVFGADQGEVSYAGWKDGKNVALIKLPAEITYAEQAMSTTDATVVYKSALPLWGKVTKVEGQDYAFETKLSRLTAYAKVVLKNGEGGGIQKVRARALRFATTADVAAGTMNVAATPAAVVAGNVVTAAQKAAFLTAIKTADADITTATPASGYTSPLATALVEDENHPLSGWFEGVLDPETDADGEYKGLLKVSQEGSVNTADSKSTITVDVNNKMKNYTSVVYIPIVAAPAPDKYELLVFEYTTDGTTWKVLRTLSDQSLTTNNGIAGMTKSYDLSYTENDIETIYQISRYMAKYNKGNGDVILNINATGTTDVATVANTKLPEMYTIYIPELKSGMTVNIGNTTGTGSKVDLTNYQLVIADAEGVTDFTKPVTLNFAGGFAAAAKNIKVVTNRPITLAGDFSALTYTGSDIIASQTSALTLGRAADATAGITALNFKANEVELKKGVAADNNINPDDLLPVAAEEAAVGSVTINNMVTNGSKIVNTDGVEITVNSGTVDEIDVNKFAAQTINVKGGKVSTITAAGIAQASVTSNLTVTVNTEGDAEITTLTAQDNGASGTAKREVKYALSATATAATMTANATAQANIYTAAQLRAVASYASATDAKLCTDITIASDATWASVTPSTNMSSFDGQNHKISGLNASLFATLANNVSNLTLENALIAKDAANQGVLAGTVTVGADITISKVNVKNSTVGAATNLASSTSNIGGLIGQANVTAAKTLTIAGCQITGTVKGYYNLGGYIGNVNTSAAGTVAFTKDNNTTKLGNDISFLKSYWTTDATDTHCGTVGNFIGSITGSAALVLKIGGTNAGKDDSFEMFFTENKITNTAVVDNTKATEGWLEFARNVNASKVYKGMENQLIGYSTGTIASGTAQTTNTGSTIFGKFNMKDGELVAAGTTGAAAITAANYINIFGDAE